MTVEISSKRQQFVTDAIARGEYSTENELVDDALRILEEEAGCGRIPAAEKCCLLGLEDFDRGDFEVFDDNSLKGLCEQIKTEGRRELERESRGA